MKLFFSLLLFCSLNLNAREIILIQSSETDEINDLTKKILTNKLKIPEEFITLKRTYKCDLKDDGIMIICLSKPLDIKVIKSDKNVLKNILEDFIELDIK